MYYGIPDQVINNCKILLSGRNIKLSAEDSVAVNEKLGSLFAVSPEAKKLHQHYLGNLYTSNYYTYMYSQLTPEAKDNLVKDYGKETFGPYASYLLAPDHIQSAALGRVFMIQLIYMINEFDKDKMLQYLTDRYPQSEYLVIINEELKKQKAKSNSSNASIVISEKSVNSLQELTSVESLKGKYIYDSLTKEIGLIDEARGLSIPKYILLDPTGKIVDGNLPRLSSLPKLKEALDKYLK